MKYYFEKPKVLKLQARHGDVYFANKQFCIADRILGHFKNFEAHIIELVSSNDFIDLRQ